MELIWCSWLYPLLPQPIDRAGWGDDTAFANGFHQLGDLGIYFILQYEHRAFYSPSPIQIYPHTVVIL